MEYFEVPEANPGQDGLCSDNSCPCGYPGAVIPRGTGYLYISQAVVDFRKNAKTVMEAEMKMNLMRAQSGSMIMFDQNVVTSTLMCEQGARKRGLDLEVAAADARHWWQTHLVPLRATPLAKAKPVIQPVPAATTAADVARVAAIPAAPVSPVYSPVSAQPITPDGNICWFCQREKPGELEIYNVVLNKTIGGQQLSKTISLKRCYSCRDIHLKHAPQENTIITIGSLFFVGICFLISFTANKSMGFWSWVVGVVVGLMGIGMFVSLAAKMLKRKANKQGIRSAGQAITDHPEVSMLTKDGWTVNTAQTGAKSI